MKNDSLKKSIDFIKTSQDGVGRREDRITLRNERWGIMTKLTAISWIISILLYYNNYIIVTL